MEILLIDIGALALFLAYIVIVYWHGVTHEAHSATRTAGRGDALLRPQARHPRTETDHLDRDSTPARSARSSVEIGQCSSQLLQ
jgi:hypothetical protein